MVAHNLIMGGKSELHRTECLVMREDPVKGWKVPQKINRLIIGKGETVV